MQIQNCRVCQSKNIKQFFDLGRQALANSLLKSPDEKEETYPLALFWCADCNLVQLGYTVDPGILFSHYVWVTGTSKGANEFAEKFYAETVLRTGNLNGKYVLEIASNDGTFLKPFQNGGAKVLGIDPAENIAEIANKNGVPTKALFFGTDTAREILKTEGPAQFVFARNVLPHVANTRDFVEGLALSVADEGIVAIEAHSAKIILEELHYDSIYHEHLCYFTFKSLERLLNDFGLFIFDIAKSPISGGSMVVYAEKNQKSLLLPPRRDSGGQAKVKNQNDAARNYRDDEMKNKTNELASWENFAKQSAAHRDKLNALLREAQKNGVIVGWGASARSSTMLNFCGIDSSLISSIIDKNPLKKGLFTAGTHIPIVSPEEGMRQNPQTVCILAWNFKEEIIEELKNKFGFKGGYVIPLPGEPRAENSK